MSTGGGSSGGGSSGSSDSEKNKTGSASKGSGQTIYGTLTPEQAQSIAGESTDYTKAPASQVAGTGESKTPTSSLLYPPSTGVSISQGGGGGGAVGTTISQAAAENADAANASPRTDSSVVLAGQVGTKPNRSPSRSNNFVSLASGAGSLGRRTQEAKRTLIGGA